MATRSGSSKRKPHVTRKATTEPSDDEDSNRKKNGGNSSINEDEDLEDLPEGTVVVQPEPVKENGKFSGPEFPSNKKKPVFADSGGHSLGRVTCTVCGDQINICKPGAARQHPRLRVLLCKSCWRYYKSGPISKDEDGLDEQCRWCSEGGKLFGCDFCHNTFCKACIMRNLGRSELSKLQQEDQRWKCYVCDPMPLSSLVETSEKVIQYMNDQLNALKEKRKTDESSKNKSISEGKNDASSKKKSEKKDEDVPQSTSKQLVSTKDKTPVQQKPAIKGDNKSRIEVVYPREKKPVTVYNSNAPGMSNSSNFQRVMGGVQVNKPFLSFDNMQIGNVHSILDKLISITSSLEILLESVKQNLRLSGASDMVSIPSNRLSTNQLMERNTAMGCIKSGVNLFLEELQIATCKNQMTNRQIFNQRFEAPAYTSTPIQTSKLGNIVKPAEVKEKEQEVMESANVGLNLEDDDDSVIIISSPSPGKGSKIDADDPPLAVEARKSEAKVKLFCENKDPNNQETNGDQASQKDETESKVTKEIDTNGQKSEKPSGESSTETEVQEMDIDSRTEEEGEKSKGKFNEKKSSPSKEKSSPSKKNDNENIAAQLELLEEMAEEILGNDSVTEKDDEKNKSVKGISPKKKKSGKETGDGKSNDEDETEKEDEDKSENEEKKSENVNEVKNDDDKEGEEMENSKKDSGSDDNDSDSDTDTSDESDDKSDDEDFNEMWSSNKKKKWLKKKNKKGREKSKQSSEKKKAGKSEKGGRLKLKLKLAGDKKSKSEEAASKKKGDDTAKSDGTSSRRRRSLRSDGKSEEKKNEKQKEKEEGAEESDFNSELEDEIDKLAKEPKSSKRKKQNDDKESKKEGNEKSTKNGKEEKSSKEKKKKGDKKNEEADNSSDDDDDDKEEDNVEDEDDEKTDEEDTPMDVPVDDYNEAKEEDVEDEEEDNADDDSSDSEVIISPRKTRNRSRQVKDEEGSTEEDNDKPKKKRTRSSLLDTKLSDSDSDFQTTKKKGKKRKASSSSKSSSDSEQEFIPLGKKKAAGKGKNSKKKPAGTGKKRRRIKAASSSSDEEKISSADDDGDDEKVQQSDDNEDEDGSPNKHKRKKIRKIKSEKKLQDQTKAAAKAEEERRKRIAEKQKEFNGIIQEIDESSPTKCPVTKQLVLEQNSETKEPVLQVDKGLIVKLKPHQVEAVQFIWNCTMESIERSKKEKGSGCILAHCMGLGKTLTVISFVHTMLANKKKTKLKTCLVVCPLNTILNWENEFAMWQEYTDKEIDVYELASVKANQDRAETLKNWQSDGGAMIIGYDMYRNLSQGNHCKSKKLKAIFHETLVDPGPDLVVCDEGHILKNDQSAISKAMNKIVSRRRIVLTGTPLQNNLSEYHCMVNFVKCNLLGTMKEFRNRFVNPITNGQCSDSTSYDVKVMKRRAHILHEKLNGCVQRKDYSALTKFLSPKFEYVLSVRLAKVQMDLYEKYLELSGFGTDAAPSRNRGARLFSDYQALMRIWTHPWVLKMDEIRQEEKRMLNDDEDSFIDDDDYDEEKSSGSDNSSNESSNDEVSAKSDDSAGPSSGRRARGKAPEADNNEVVKKWKSRTRGGGGEFPQSDEEYEPLPLTYEWWADYVDPEDKFKIELSGKLVLLFEILKRCEEIGDKVLVFSQSLLSLDLIEAFLENVDKQHQEETAEKDKKEEAMPEEAGFGKHWTRGEDYFRMDGSTNAQNRKDLAEAFNDPENFRARLFLISTRAGGLGINLVAANRVIIFDASWNPSHDVQSIFRVYRFGQEKPVYVYRFLAQGTMEEKIYERQVTKQSLSQRVVDEHQIERHFSAADMSELYNFKPDRLDDPNRKEKTPILPKDTLLAELMTSQKDWIVSYHEHDSLLENKIEEELSEEERKAAWEEFENERTGINQMRQNVMGMGFQNMVNSMMMQSGSAPVMNMGDLQTMAQMGITQQSLLLLVQEMKQRYPHLPQEQLTMQVQNVIRQMITRQIMAKQEMQKREMEAKEMQYQHRLRQIHTQIEQQQQRLLQSQMYGQPRPSLGINPAYAHLLRNPNSGPQNRPSSSANRASPNPSSSELMKQLQGSKPS